MRPNIFSANTPLALIGCGNMGQALARGWCNKAITADELIIVDRHPDKRDSFYNDVPCRHVPDMSLLAAHQPAAICLGVKPHQLHDVLSELKTVFAEAHPIILSVVAGKAIAEYEAALWPDAAIIRVMPNTPSSIAMGMSGCFANQRVSAAQRSAIDALMLAVGKTLWLQNESQMHLLTAISGSGPAYVFYLMECFINTAIAKGLPAQDARLLVAQTFAGAAQLVHSSSDDVSALREHVTSPHGTTHAGLEKLMSNRLERLIEETIEAAVSRSETLMSTS